MTPRSAAKDSPYTGRPCMVRRMIPTLIRLVRAGAIRTAASRGVVLALMLTATLAASPAGAERDHSIVAVVNSDIVSQRDIDNRMALFLATGNLSGSPEIRERLAPEVLTMLIEDSLKRQEARRLKIAVPSEETDRMLMQVASQIKVPPEDLPRYLSRQNVSIGTLREQIETELAWVKVVTRLAGDSAAVSDDEIDEELARRRAAAGRPEFRVAEIFLPVETPPDDQNVRDLAGRLINEIRAGASFSGLARIFSRGPAASNGGDLGWLRQGQLDPELDRVVAGLEPGQIAGPIRSPRGYHLVVLFAKRVAGMPGGSLVLGLHQVFAPLPAGAGQAQTIQRIEAVRGFADGADSCEALAKRGSGRDGIVSTSLGKVDTRRLPPELQEVVAPLKVGEMTAPMRATDGIAMLMVCERDEVAADDEVRGALRRFLREERLAVASRRLLRGLKRDALVEIRP